MSSCATRAFVAFALGGMCLPGCSQRNPVAINPMLQTVTGEVEMPHDPDALMLLAARMNGLDEAGMKPWHLKASYTVLDEKGTAKEQGTLEEFWAGPRRNRTTYTVGAESETIYVTDDGSLRTGALSQPNSLAQEADQEFVRPLPAQAYIAHQSFEKHAQKVGETKLECVAEKPASDIQRVGLPLRMYCFNLDKPILRIDVSASGRKQAIRNAVVMFEGKYVPKNIRIMEPSNASMTAHLESLEVISHVDDADFTPPADAKPLPRRITISSGVASGLLLNQVPPHYPDQAKKAHVSGTVVIRVRIGTDGQIHDPEITSGPPMLVQAALDAVKNWVYRPYTLNGEAVEVDTQVNIIFNLAP
jgi:TonB family protein